jgi:hypothetical protein
MSKEANIYIIDLNPNMGEPSAEELKGDREGSLGKAKEIIRKILVEKVRLSDFPLMNPR